MRGEPSGRRFENQPRFEKAYQKFFIRRTSRHPFQDIGVQHIPLRLGQHRGAATCALLNQPFAGERLEALAAARRPSCVAILGVTAYRTAFGRPRAAIGPQPDSLGGARLWILPNPSGLNAHYQPAALAQLFGDLRLWAIARHGCR